jgi:hypothetical protein
LSCFLNGDAVRGEEHRSGDQKDRIGGRLPWKPLSPLAGSMTFVDAKDDMNRSL